MQYSIALLAAIAIAIAIDLMAIANALNTANRRVRLFRRNVKVQSQCEEETTSFVEDLFNREGEMGREPRLNNFYALQNKTRANYFSFLID